MYLKLILSHLSVRTLINLKSSTFQKMAGCNINYMHSVANGTNTQTWKKIKQRYSPLSYSLIFALLCSCYHFQDQAFIKATFSTVQTFQDSAYRITWQLMICKIQLTVCKHKKAVRNEKRAKTSKIDKAFMTAWHFTSTAITASCLKISLCCTFRCVILYFSYLLFLTNRNAVVYIWTSKWKADCDSYITDWQHKRNLHKWSTVLEKHRIKVHDQSRL